MSNTNIIDGAAQFGLGGLGDGDTKAKAANMVLGTQLGAGIRPANIDAATPLSFVPTVLVVLQTPTMWSNEPAVGQMLKTLIESHAKTVSGIDFGYTLETEAQPMGHDGQEIHVPTKAKRSAVQPSFVFPEVTGNIVWNLFRQWLFDIQDPDTNASMSRFDAPGVFMNSTYCMSMMAIQFDRTMRPENIIDAAFYGNMFPTDPGGQLGLERQIAQTKVMERTVNMTGHVQHTDMTRKLGIEIAKQLNLAKLRYNTVNPTLTQVTAGLKDSGLAAELAALTGEPAATV